MKITARSVLFVALSLLFALNVIWAGLRIQTQSQICKDTRFAIAHGDNHNLDGSHYMCHKLPIYTTPDNIFDMSDILYGDKLLYFSKSTGSPYTFPDSTCQNLFGDHYVVTLKQRTEGVHFFLTQDILKNDNGNSTIVPQCALSCDAGDIKPNNSMYNVTISGQNLSFTLPSYKFTDSKSTMITVTSLLTNIGVIVSSGVFFMICVTISIFPPNKNALGWWLAVHFVVDLLVIALACITVLAWNGDRFDLADEHCRLSQGYVTELTDSMSIGQAPAILSLGYIMIRVAFYLIVYTPAFISNDTPLVESEKGMAFTSRSRPGDEEEEYTRLDGQPASRGMTTPFRRY